MIYEQKSISACRLADRALDLTQVLDHVVELLDRLDTNHRDAVVLVRPVDVLLEPGRLDRLADQVGVLGHGLASGTVMTASMLPLPREALV